MRIHTSACTEEDLRHAAELAGVSFVKLVRHGSRSHGTAFEAVLSGSGARSTLYRVSEWKAATWDESGVFLGLVFDRDLNARVAGSYVSFSSGAHFRWATVGRYTDGPLSVAERHWRHAWRYVGHAVTRVYSVKECRGCPAVLRVLADDYSFEGLG